MIYTALSHRNSPHQRTGPFPIYNGEGTTDPVMPDVRTPTGLTRARPIPALFLPDGRNAKKLNKFRGFLMISGATTAPSLDRSLTRCKCYLHLQDAEGLTPWVFFSASLGWFGGFPLGW